MEMTFGVVDHLDKNDQPTADMFEDRLKLIELYDQAGFYAFHLTEHHATPLGLAPSPNVFLAAATQRAKTLRFASLIYILPLYDPVRLASEICMLDHISCGRIEVGVGRGISPYELAYYNISHLEAPEIFREAYQVMMQALQNESVNFKGEYFTYRGTPMELRPYQQPHPPLWYGPGSPSSVEWCAREGMNIVSNKPLDVAKDQITQFGDFWATYHGSKPLPKVAVTRHIYVADTDEEAVEIGTRGFRMWYDRYAYLWKKFDPRPSDDELALSGGRGAGTLIFGSPATVREEIERQIAATGINYFVTRFAFGDLTLEESTRSLGLFTDEVMPHFQQLAAE